MTYSDEKMQNFLSTVTDALVNDERDVDSVISQHNLPERDVHSFIRVIRRLLAVLVPVQPSRRFAHRLKLELMGVPERSVLDRIRYLPARVHIAALLAVGVGVVMLLARLRLPVPAPRAAKAPVQPV